jgi:uncharacterized protein YerC
MRFLRTWTSPTCYKRPFVFTRHLYIRYSKKEILFESEDLGTTLLTLQLHSDVSKFKDDMLAILEINNCLQRKHLHLRLCSQAAYKHLPAVIGGIS